MNPMSGLITFLFAEHFIFLAINALPSFQRNFRFQETVIFFCVKPRSGDKEVTPEYFFSQWSIFCQDFKDQWKREQQRLTKIRWVGQEIARDRALAMEFV